MKILEALGFGLAIIMFKFLVPRIFAGIENVLLTFFDTLQFAMTATRGTLQAGSYLPTHVPSVNLAR